MFNLIQAANALKELPDDALPQLMQGADPNVPTYLVMSEVQRRKEMRNNPMLQPSQADRTTVMENMQQETMQQGIPALPQSVDTEPAPQEFADGGIVRLAGGGFLDDIDAYIGDTQRKLLENQRRWSESRKRKAVEQRARQQNNPVVNYITENEARADAQRAADQAKPVTQQTIPTRFTGYMNDRLNEMDQFVGDTQQMMLDNERMADEQRAKAAQEYRAKKAIEASIHRPKEAVPPPLATPSYVPEDEPMPRGRGGVSSGLVPQPVAASEMPPQQPAAMSEGLGALLPAAPEPELAAPEKPSLKSYKDYLPEIKENMPDIYGDMLTKAEAKKAGISERKRDAMNMALIQAGLGMMASKNSSLMGAIGEGGLAGINTMAQGMRDVRAAEDAADERMDSIRLAQQRGLQDQYKMASGMANDENRNNMGMWREDLNNFRTDKRLTHQEEMANRRHELTERMAQNRFDQQMALERYKQGEQNRRSSASIAARGKGGGKPAKRTDKQQMYHDIKASNPNMTPEQVWARVAELTRAPGKTSGRSTNGFKPSDFKVEFESK